MTTYRWTCPGCGRTFKVPEESEPDLCSECSDEASAKRARAEQALTTKQAEQARREKQARETEQARQIAQSRPKFVRTLLSYVFWFHVVSLLSVIGGFVLAIYSREFMYIIWGLYQGGVLEILAALILLLLAIEANTRKIAERE